MSQFEETGKNLGHKAKGPKGAINKLHLEMFYIPQTPGTTNFLLKSKTSWGWAELCQAQVKISHPASSINLTLKLLSQVKMDKVSG